jgi:Zn-dependent protease
MEKAKVKNLINSIKRAIKVPLKFHWSVLILPFLLFFYNGILGVPLFLMLFGSLLFHEYSHVMMAQHKGYYVPYVLAHGFGAMAMVKIDNLENFKDNFWIAVAGPAASFILGGVGFILYLFFPSIWTLYLVYINLIFGLFNLLPLFPSDGGRILYSILGKRMGGLKAIKISVLVSWILCGVGTLFCLVFGLYWIAIVLVLCILMSIQEKSITEARLKGYDIVFK